MGSARKTLIHLYAGHIEIEGSSAPDTTGIVFHVGERDFETINDLLRLGSAAGYETYVCDGFKVTNEPDIVDRIVGWNPRSPFRSSVSERTEDLLKEQAIRDEIRREPKAKRGQS